ncbi:mechanosensitive ion channel, partial [candidate division WOR-3 bacterium]|nr:mechanosensitive ion channel [candidate division WOR-3 bacterium]
VSFITVFFLFWLWIAGIRSMATYLGLLSAGIAIALKDFIINLAGLVFIIWRKPFDVGDRIEIGNKKGDIIDIRIFEFSMLEVGSRIDAEQSTGRVLHIPNGQILSKPLANYNREFNYIWNEIPVVITFESNWKKAKKILFEIGEKHSSHLNETARKSIKAASKKFLIYYSSLTPTVYTKTKDYGIILTLRYLCEPKKIRISESEIWEDLLKEIKKSKDIEFAYPTYRITEREQK